MLPAHEGVAEAFASTIPLKAVAVTECQRKRFDSGKGVGSQVSCAAIVQ